MVSSAPTPTMSASSSATVFYRDLSPRGRGVGARSSQGYWIIHAKQGRPKAPGFRDPGFESRRTPENLKKICIHKKPLLDRAILRGFDIHELYFDGGGNHGGNGGGNRAGDGGRDGDDNDGFNGSNDPFILRWWVNGLIIHWQVFSRDKMCLNRALVSLYVVGYLCYTQLFSALAKTAANGCPQSEDSSMHRSLAKRGAEVEEKGEMPDVVWEVKGGRWRKVLLDYKQDEFVVDGVRGRQDEARTSAAQKKNEIPQIVFGKRGPESIFSSSLTWCRDLILRLMLPEGYPESVTSDYLEYSLWRAGQGIASQIGGVLTTQALLYAVGLGKGAIPTAAAVNWVLKDGIGYLSKILLSKYGRHFDVHPKGWRLFADLLENAACGMELLTPAFPHFFVYLGAVAGAGRSAAGLIQAATRSCFYAGFAAQRNFAEVIAKSEAQGLVSKSLGIMFGIALSNYTGSSGPLVVASFAVVTGIHMFCNLKSYQAIQLRTLNPYRASLIFIEYLHSGCIPSIKEVNDEEPIFGSIPLFSAKLKPCQESSEALSVESKEAAAKIDAKLQLGSKFKDVVHSQEEADTLFNLYQNERYLLAEHDDKFLVMLKGGATPQDMLRAMFQVCHLCWLERHLGIKSRGAINDCKPGGKLAVSHDYLEREFTNVQQSATKVGWLAEGLVARPLPFRVHFNYVIP